MRPSSFQYILLTIHVAGCIFYLIAVIEGIEGESWTARYYLSRWRDKGIFQW